MTKLSREIIAYRRNRILVTSDKLVDPRDLSNERNLALITLINELEQFGYFLSSEVSCRITVEDMKGVFNNLLPHISEERGRGNFKALYPGFPQQVIEKSDAELWIDRDRVYTGDLEGFLRDNPWETKEQKSIINSEPTRELKMMTQEEFMKIPQQIMSSGNSLTAETREELIWFLDEYKDLPIPERIPFKETLCLVASKRNDLELKEVNDVLRYGIYLMGGSPELYNVPKTVKTNSWSRQKDPNPEWRDLIGLPRSRRKEICERLEKIIENKGFENCIKDAKSKYGHWVLLSERVHPGEYILRFPETARFFHHLKTNILSKEYKTFYSELQKKYDNNEDIIDIAKFISTRPGELVRRFDSLIRKAAKEKREDEVLDIFLNTEGMKNKTLIELLSYYDRRNIGTQRIVQIKSDGEAKKIFLDPLEKLSEFTIETVRDIVIRKILLNIKNRVVEKDLENKIVYLDPSIKRIAFPKGMRDQSISIPIGTRFKIENGKILRFFVHWIQQDGRYEDLDLHAFLWKSDTDMTTIGWNSSYKGEGNLAVYSGDIRHKKGNCAEYIDVDIEAAKKVGVKYIVADITNYEGRGLDSLPCWVGYLKMSRLDGGKKNWVPKDVELSVEMKCKSSNVAAFLVDIEKSEIMILDFPIDQIPVIGGHSYGTQTTIIKYFSVELKYTTYDILECYYKARGAEITNLMPKEEDEIEVAEKVEFSDISSDYVKVLSIIGE